MSMDTFLANRILRQLVNPCFSVLVAFVLILSAPAFADTSITPTSITSVLIYTGTSGAPGAQVLISPAMPGVEGCPYAPGNILWIDFTSQTLPTGRDIYATVLAASLAGKAITFEVRGCGNNGQQPLIYAVSFTP